MTVLLGREITYEVSNGEIRKGKIIGYEHNVELNKELFKCVSPYGNRFRLSRSEFELVEEQDNELLGTRVSYEVDNGDVSKKTIDRINTCMMCLENTTYDEICDKCNDVIEAGMMAFEFKRRSELGQDMDGDTVDLEKTKIGSDLT